MTTLENFSNSTDQAEEIKGLEDMSVEIMVVAHSPWICFLRLLPTVNYSMK